MRRLLVVGAIVLGGVAIACSEDAPTSPVGKKNDASKLDNRAVLAALSCHASVAEGTVTCGAPTSGRINKEEENPNQPANIIIGGQNVFVRIQTTNVNYSAGTGAFTFDATVRNLIAQPIGTADTTGAQAPDAEGVNVFFAAGPTVTGGTGTATVVGDGIGTFTAGSQPYYRYSTVLDQYEVSAPKTWTINMPPTVTTFDFLLLVSAAVPRPFGYIELQLSSLKPPTDRQVSYFSRNANGTADGAVDPITWSVSDTTRATIGPTGLVNPLRPGSVTILAQQGARVGYLTMTVQPLRRIWKGTEDTRWENGRNWLPDSVKPEPTDTAVVADSAATIFPVLNQNESIAGVEVDDVTPGGTIPSVSLNAFNLTASGDVFTTNSGAISNTSGTLFLTGIARTIKGLNMPFLRFTGTYSLTGNVTSRAPLRVDLGRLTRTGFRIQAQSF